MALKDWKKTNSGIYGIWQWESKDGSILKVGKSHDYEKNEDYFDVRLGLYNPYLIKMQEQGKLKTKAQAFKLAKEIMRTH